jgi:hypothetical protein
MPLAACLRADGSDDNELQKLVNLAAAALSNHDDERFMTAFDPAMKGRRELAAGVHALLRDADVQARVEILAERMNWTLEITAHDASAGVTNRRGEVRYSAAQSGGKLRIVSFEAGTLFAQPHGREAWDAISGVAQDMQLASRYADGEQTAGLAGPIDLPRLLERFDHAMPGYEQFAANLRALTSSWIVEPELQLTGNEGDDERRSLDIDWSMMLTDPANKGGAVRKQQTVKCTVALVDRPGKGGKQWLIVSLAPLEFFAPPQ